VNAHDRPQAIKLEVAEHNFGAEGSEELRGGGIHSNRDRAHTADSFQREAEPRALRFPVKGKHDIVGK
jgi:hypothetical protein